MPCQGCARNNINPYWKSIMRTKTIRVLIVDDDSKIRTSLTRDFEDAGFGVTSAVSAAEAKVILKTEEFDAILCDNQMTGATGTLLLADISKSFPKIKRFMLSGNISATQTFLVEKEIGVSQLFEKPCSSKTIIEAITKAVDC